MFGPALFGANDIAKIAKSADTYRTESFKRTEDLYIKQLIDSLQLRIDKDLVVVLMKGASQPGAFLIDGKELHTAIESMIQSGKNWMGSPDYLAELRKQCPLPVALSLSAWGSLTQGSGYGISDGYSSTRCANQYIPFNVLSRYRTISNINHGKRLDYLFSVDIATYVQIASLIYSSYQRYAEGWNNKLQAEFCKTMLRSKDGSSVNDACMNAKLRELTNRIDTLEDNAQLESKECTCMSEIDQLKSEVSKLREKLASNATGDSTNEYVKRVELVPVYDYELIKARRRLLHREYHSAFKFFARLIRIRYDTPLAIAVMVTK